MITVKHLDSGYVFMQDGKELAVGEYDSGVFILLEETDSTTWGNAMLAMSYLRRKHTPEFYTKSIFKLPAVEDNTKTTLSRYKGHIALQTIDKEAFHAWELKNGSRRS
jgi:hypothetical protein